MFPLRKRPGKFGRNVLILVTGTTIAKGISIAAIPILTRLYTPFDFGILGFYSSAVAVISVFATARYELAVLQCRNARDADHLVAGAMSLAAVFSAISLMGIVVWKDQLVLMIEVPEVGPWLYLVPVSVFFTACYQSLNYWLNRRQEYRRMGRNRVLQASLAASGNLGFGVMGYGVSGLILGQFIAQVATTWLLLKRFLAHSAGIDKLRMMALFKRHVDYPKYDLPASSMNVLAQQAPNLLFTPLFGAVAAGHYFLIQRLFMLPVTLISSSIGSVFRQTATEQYQKTGSFLEIFWSVFRKLSLIAVPLTIIFMLVSEDLFAIVFGAEWAIAGKYARILAPMFMLKFIISPLTYAFYVTNKLHFNTIGQALYLLMITGSVFVGFVAGKFALTIYLIAISSSFLYLAYFAVSIKLAVGSDR